MMTETDEQQEAKHEFIIVLKSDCQDRNTSGKADTSVDLWIHSNPSQIVLMLHLLGREMRRPS